MLQKLTSTYFVNRFKIIVKMFLVVLFGCRQLHNVERNTFMFFTT